MDNSVNVSHHDHNVSNNDQEDKPMGMYHWNIARAHMEHHNQVAGICGRVLRYVFHSTSDR